MNSGLSPRSNVCLGCILSPYVSIQRRTVSRTSAINRGLRASKQGSTRGEGRSAFASGDRSRDTRPSPWGGERPREARSFLHPKRGDSLSRQGSEEPKRAGRSRPEAGRAELPDPRKDSPWHFKHEERLRKKGQREQENGKEKRDGYGSTREGSKTSRHYGDKPSSAWTERHTPRHEKPERERERTKASTGRRSSDGFASQRRDYGDKPERRPDRQQFSDAFTLQRRDAVDDRKMTRGRQDDHGADSLGFGGSAPSAARESKPSDKPDRAGLRLIKHTSDGESNPFQSDGSSATIQRQRTKSQRRVQDSLASQQSCDRDESSEIPLAIPYTTATSQFLYGTNVVLAALRAKRRKLHCLHLRSNSDSTPYPRSEALTDIKRLAKTAAIPIKHSSPRLLDTLSENRPHNGQILEASPLPAPPILSLQKVPSQSSTIPLDLDRLSPDEPIPPSLPSPQTWRRPFVLFLDGITDPGNLGNILRTAYFYGVDAVVVATNTCAPITSPIVAKASAGACEALPIYSSPKPANFIFESAKAGWRVYAAAAPEPEVGTKRRTVTAQVVAAKSPLEKYPVILMLGAEGEGLRGNLRSKADVDVGIEGADSFGGGGGGRVDVGVESLNVGVAAGVLVEAFMRRPGGT